MHYHTSRSKIVLLPLCAAICILFGSVYAASAKLQPTGTKVGAVQFDAIITLESPSTHCFVQIFARYWVSPDFYHVAVIWAEPHGRGLYFPVYPPTLSVGSDSKSFGLSHDVYPVHNRSFSKPLESEVLFTNMFGDYPIQNIRFAEQKALAGRIYATDVVQRLSSSIASDQTLQIPLLETRPGLKRSATNLEVRATTGRIDSLRLINSERQAIKIANYEYEDNGNAPKLRRQIVTLPEQPAKIGLLGPGMTVTYRDVPYRFTELDGRHRKGGRICTVEYQTLPFGELAVSLPCRVEVRNGSEKRLLRSAELMNFQKIELTADGARQAVAQFAGFTGPHREYRELLDRYWKHEPNQVSAPDAEALRQLRVHFRTKRPQEATTVGEELRRLNILMEISRMLGDDQDLERVFELYLTALADHRLSETLLVGGYCAIDTLIIWGRTKMASALLNRWIAAASQIDDFESVHRFATRELKRGNFWSTIQLLEKFLDRPSLPPHLRFEFAAMKCVAFQDLQSLVRKRGSLQDSIAKAHVNWVDSLVNSNRLDQLVLNSLPEAEQLFAKLQDPTETQKELLKRLSLIAMKRDRKDTPK